MVKYPYIPSMRPLRKFLQDIQTMGTPPKINSSALSQMGLKTSNASYIPPILKFIGFIDDSGGPTENYKNFKKKETGRSVMAGALKGAYADLFQLYPDAQLREFDVLRDFFVGTTDAGASAVKYTVETFKTLCDFADFGAVSTSATTQQKPTLTQIAPPLPVQLPISREGGVNVNVNIKFELPITKDSDVYDKIFESLKKHLLTPSSKTD